MHSATAAHVDTGTGRVVAVRPHILWAHRGIVGTGAEAAQRVNDGRKVARGWPIFRGRTLTKSAVCSASCEARPGPGGGSNPEIHFPPGFGGGAGPRTGGGPRSRAIGNPPTAHFSGWGVPVGRLIGHRERETSGPDRCPPSRLEACPLGNT